MGRSSLSWRILIAVVIAAVITPVLVIGTGLANHVDSVSIWVIDRLYPLVFPLPKPPEEPPRPEEPQIDPQLPDRVKAILLFNHAEKVRDWYRAVSEGIAYYEYKRASHQVRIRRLHTTGTQVGRVFCSGLVGGLLACVLLMALSRRRAILDEHTRCGNCGHILKGLSEPRCPECGRAI